MGSRFLIDEPDLETEHVCSHCGDNLELVDEILLLQVIYPNRTNEGNAYFIVEDDVGDYAYTPQYFHLQCWEEIAADLDGYNEEREPFFEPEDLWECDSCTSSINRWETTGMLNEGELRQSRREPNGEPTIYFDTCNIKPRFYCASCLRTVNDDIIELWDTFSHNGECAEGTRQRCWRLGTCRFGCAQQPWAAE